MSNSGKSNIFLRDAIIFLTALSLVGYFVYLMWQIFFPVAISVIFAYLLNPLIAKLNNKYNLNRIGGILLIYVSFFVVLFFFFYFFIPIIIREFISLRQNVPNYISSLQTIVNAGQIKIQTLFIYIFN